MSEQIESRDVELIVKYCSARLEPARAAIKEYLETPREATSADRIAMEIIQQPVQQALLPVLKVKPQRDKIDFASVSASLEEVLKVINDYWTRIPEGAKTVIDEEIRPELVKVKEIIDFCIQSIWPTAPQWLE